jgi:hypothetical protein
MQTEHVTTLAYHALAHLEECFDLALDRPIHCRTCGAQLYEDLAHYIEREPDGVRVSLICSKCDTPRKRASLRRSLLRKWLKPTVPSCMIECDAESAPTVEQELQSLIDTGGE